MSNGVALQLEYKARALFKPMFAVRYPQHGFFIWLR